MKHLDKIKNVIIIICFVVVVAFPYYATFFGFEEKLVGAEEKVKLSFETIDDYIMQNFPGRTFVINTKNRFLYETFDISPNESIVKVKDTLLAVETLNYYYHDLYKEYDKDVKTLVNKFKELNEICKEKNKKILIITTPTKVRYYDGPVPFVDNLILNHEAKDYQSAIKGYDILKDELKKTDIYYFDCIEAIDKDRYKYFGGVVPLFYKGAHHWSNYKARLVSFELHDYMRDVMGIKVPHMSTKASKSEIAMEPDSDLFDVLNLGIKPHEEYYHAIDVMDKFESDELNFTIRGGSFMTGLVLIPITVGYNNKTVLMSNKEAFYNNYKNHITFDSYEELDKKIGLVDQIKNTDVFIFEIHEVNVYNATFGFLDYILEHKEEL